MDTEGENPRGRSTATSSIGVFVSLAGVAMAMTWLFLGMRAVMKVGGFCAEGGPYQIATPCPKGIPLVMMAAIWGGLIFAGIYAFQAIRSGVPSFIGFLWPALFLSLGWNFFEYGFNPPEGSGVQLGWVIPGVLFALMGGIPLLFAIRGLTRPRPAAPSLWGMTGSLKSAAQGMAMLRALRKAAWSNVPSAGSDPNAPTGPGPWFTPQPPTAGTAPGTTPTVESSDLLVRTLERLDALHRSGALTEEEYAKAKRDILEASS
jgi:hypothetical protein